jgi:hypothetical protein
MKEGKTKKIVGDTVIIFKSHALFIIKEKTMA